MRIFFKGKSILSQRNEEPEFDLGEIVWIRPGLFTPDDKRDYIVMTNSISTFGGWACWIVPAEDHLGSPHECFAQSDLTRANPYAPECTNSRMTRTGRRLIIVEGGFPELKRLL